MFTTIGTAIKAMIASITITAKSSIKVKPNAVNLRELDNKNHLC